MNDLSKKRVAVVVLLVFIMGGMSIEYMNRMVEEDALVVVTVEERDSKAKTLLPETNDATTYGLDQTDVSLSDANATLIAWDGVAGMNEIITRYWKGNLFCEKINEVRSAALDADLPITVSITFGCRELYDKSEMGTGNFIALLYGMRLAAHAYGNVGLNFTCYDAEETKNELILPWLTGWFPPRPLSQDSSIPISVQQACGNYDTQPLSYMFQEIQHDLRKMAVGLMGVPQLDHPSASFVDELRSRELEPIGRPSRAIAQFPTAFDTDNPPYPTTEYDLDDAVLHFRCGDLMDSRHPSFGFMKFSGYTRHISPEAQSIGILTQPFDVGAQSRKADSSQYKRDRCRTVVYSLVEYIENQYPGVRVRIHNNITESIALTFARMIMANQTIAGISSFGVIPAVSTFGTGYIRLPDYPKAPNKWLLNPRIDELADNVVLFYEPKRIMVGAIKGLWQNEGEQSVLQWFWNDTVV